MKKTECFIRGYEIGKNTRLHGEIKLAREIAALTDEEKSEGEIQSLCLDCVYAKINICDYYNKHNNVYPNYKTDMFGFTNVVSKCDGFKSKS